MITQRRVLNLVHLFTAQGLTLVAATLDVGYLTAQHHLYVSAGATFLLKVVPLPNTPMTMLVGILLVAFAFNLATPIAALSSSIARSTLGIALASVLLSFMMMITRAKALPQVIGFLSMENSLFFAATAATNGMPMLVELGIALDVLMGFLSLGVFMFQIREQFDSLDIRHLERLRED